MRLELNAELLDFRETAPADWNEPGTLLSSPSRAVFVEEPKQWALLLQRATDRVLDYSKPQNAFDNIPCYRTLMLVPENLADGSYSQSFIAAVSSTKNRPLYRAYKN